MKKIDVLWLVEHIAREMDVACAVKCLAQARYGVDITMRHIYLHANEVMKKYDPAVVVFPFLYRTSDLAIDDYISVWPNATYLNLAWEQIHYKAHLKMKAPGDEFTRQRVIHHAWGDFYRNYLLESGVPPEHVFVNGNPVYQLYKSPYEQYYKPRDWLAHEYGLDDSSRWIFIPENYKWAFFDDGKIQRFANKGGDLDELLNMRAFCQESLAHLLRWCNETARNGQLEIIFRPRPATMLQQMEAFFGRHVGSPVDNLHFIKGESVREWILASDVVISSYSTSLIEAAVANKPIYMAEPIPIPESLHCDWYDYAPRLHSSSEFEEVCLTESDNGASKLRLWAQEEMLANGDPIEGLADFVARLVEKTKISNADIEQGRFFTSKSPRLLSLRVRGKRRIEQLVKYPKIAFQSLFHATKAELRRHLAPNSGAAQSETGVGKAVSGSFIERAKSRSKSTFSLLAQGFEEKDYFVPSTHENDEFTETEVQTRVDAWCEILVSQAPQGDDRSADWAITQPSNSGTAT